MIRSGSVKIVLILYFIACLVPSASAQEIKVSAQNMPLNEVLAGLRLNYGIQYSVNHKLASNCSITLSESFASPEATLQALLDKCNFSYKYIDEVFIIYEKINEEVEGELVDKSYYFSGQLVDALSLEPLPYSTLQCSQGGFCTDENGNFSFKSKKPQEMIKASYLGYFVLDTVLAGGESLQLLLSPSVVGLTEVVVNSNTKLFDAHIGEKAGLIKLNHKVATFLPGNNNNTLFNMLRLQPGITAAAEQSSDYMIWGSYRGQNLLKFDGITLFSVNGQNKEIGIVNPLLIQDVEVYKGGYNVDKGDRVGSVIQITGTSGNKTDFGTHVNVNNQTVGGMLNIPIAQRYALQVAFRQSYFSVFDWKSSATTNASANETFEPEYAFRDLNLKFSGQLGNGDQFHFSFLGNADNSSSVIENETKYMLRNWESYTDKQQLGFSVNYNKYWQKAGRTTFAYSFSQQRTSSFNSVDYEAGKREKKALDPFNVYNDNGINELSAKVDHNFPTTGNSQVAMGLSVIRNQTTWNEDSVQLGNNTKRASTSRVGLYVKDDIQLGSFLKLQPGVKFDFLSNTNQVFIQPRVNAEFSASRNLRITMAWGKYNQYITEMAMVDEFENRYYFWGISDNSEYPVVEGQHNVLGLSYAFKGFALSAEGFYKYYKGLSKFGVTRKNRELIPVEGIGQAMGLDLHLKKKVGVHDFWMSYTLSKTEEDFSLNQKKGFELAPQDQRHEWKAASVLNFSPWYISANYVYGSGLWSTVSNENKNPIAYNRLDLALLYKFNTSKFRLETGVSVQNVLNNENVTFNGFSNLPGGRKVYEKGIPFTPSVFVNMSF